MKPGSLICWWGILITPAIFAVDLKQIYALESKGAVQEARKLLKTAATAPNSTTESKLTYAEFLDERRDPGTLAAYQSLLQSLPPSSPQRLAIERRIQLLNLISSKKQPYQQSTHPITHLPGPMRSFNRMAAISPDLAPDDLLGALARNIVTNGYQASSGQEALEQTEYLKLVVRYLSQARELEKLADTSGMIRIEECDSTITADILRILGYRMRGGCGNEVVLETVNASRAFLTIDSGFPLAQLEHALRTNTVFVYDYRPTPIPVLYGPEYWMSSKDKKTGTDISFIDYMISDPSVCRFYLGLSKLDAETAEALKNDIPLPRLKAFAHILDFYGGMFQVRNGKAIIPGGSRSASGWLKLTGTSPDQGGKFFGALMAKDDGWLASYFDATARLNGNVQDYLTDPSRMERFYTAIRGRITSPGPARPVFRANTDMMLLTNRLRLEADGRPHIPGSIEVWKQLFIKHPNGKYDGKLTKSAAGWKEPDDVLEALFALTRKSVENEPLKIFMALSDINRKRTTPLLPETVDRLAREWRTLGSQYMIFAEIPQVSDQTLLSFLENVSFISDIRDQQIRSDAAGLQQALVGLWQIFCRQNLIAASDRDATLSSLLSPFSRARSSIDLFDAGRSGVNTLLSATNSQSGVNTHDRFLDLLAGESKVTDHQSHTQLVQEMSRIFESQRLLPLSLIFELADNLTSVAQGGKLNSQLVGRFNSRVQEIQPARISLSGAEKNALAYGYSTERHIEIQRKVNFRQLVDRSTKSPEKLAEAKEHLTKFLRDTLVGLNYIHYAPPGAQILITNPLFVRSHDFIGVQGINQTWRGTEVFGSGWPSSAGGRLVGSLVNLPYALANAEQNFLIPTREQALIWGDLVPQMMVSAKVPRWWTVTPTQMHLVGLHLRLGESAIAEASMDQGKREAVLNILSRQIPPARLKKIEAFLNKGNANEALESVLPSESMILALSLLEEKISINGPETAGIQRLQREAPDQHSFKAISFAFGTPKPTLAHSYSPELLNLRTFPTLMGFSSRILAESWESSTLYYVALADELDMTPAQLNIQVPIWTQKTVEAIFATHLEDWPALLRSLRIVGEGVRTTHRTETDQKASLLED